MNESSIRLVVVLLGIICLTCILCLGVAEMRGTASERMYTLLGLIASQCVGGILGLIVPVRPAGGQLPPPNHPS